MCAGMCILGTHSIVMVEMDSGGGRSRNVTITDRNVKFTEFVSRAKNKFPDLLRGINNLWHTVMTFDLSLWVRQGAFCWPLCLICLFAVIQLYPSCNDLPWLCYESPWELIKVCGSAGSWELQTHPFLLDSVYGVCSQPPTTRKGSVHKCLTSSSAVAEVTISKFAFCLH